MKENYEVIVVGAGYAGSIMARKFADAGKKVLLLEKRAHIAGNMYDYIDESGILVHKYGPHISCMNQWKTYNFLNQYSEFVPYQHHVLAEIDGIEVPLLFNLNSIDKLFPVEKAIRLKEILIDMYGMNSKVPILELRKSENSEIRDLAEFVYEKVFYHYTTKMWGMSPEEMDSAVTGRVPVSVSYDDRHFTQLIQVMPKEGFTKLFENMLNHENISVCLNVNALDHIRLSEGDIYYDGELFNGKLIYTGEADRLFDFKYGRLPYRSLYFENKTYNVDKLQDSTVLNWPDARPETRRTEFKKLVCQPNVPGVTSVVVEYPGEYNEADEKWNEPYYAIINDETDVLYAQYKEEAQKYKSLILIGRLAEYKYYNMESVILSTLNKYDEISQ